MRVGGETVLAVDVAAAAAVVTKDLMARGWRRRSRSVVDVDEEVDASDSDDLVLNCAIVKTPSDAGLL